MRVVTRVSALRRTRSPQEVTTNNGLLILVFLLASLPAASGVAASRAQAGEASLRNAYAGHSDQELSALAANWASLDVKERRALLTEAKRRMAHGADGVIRLRTERRYGRIIRQPDGSLLRIETQVVRVQSLPDDPRQPQLTDEPIRPNRRGFGVGFEHRVARREPIVDAETLMQDAELQAGILDLEILPAATQPPLYPVAPANASSRDDYLPKTVDFVAPAP